MQELKPCPFCPDGGHPYIFQLFRLTAELGYRVRCFDCESSSGIHGTKEAAIKAWNTRPYMFRYKCRSCELEFDWLYNSACPRCGEKMG